MATKKDDFPIEVITSHAVIIRWDFSDAPGTTRDYRENFAKKVDQACYEIGQAFGIQKDCKQFYPMDNYHHKLIQIRGLDFEKVREAGEALAKVIFSHRYVVPSNHASGIR